MKTKSKFFVLPVIVISQFLCTSLWFAGNGVMDDLVTEFMLPTNSLGLLTAAVQFGFITGTLTYAILMIADRYSPSLVFTISAFCAMLFNTGLIWEDNSIQSLLIFRFLTGFFLAGVYPVGMKIAADHFDKGLGRSLGYLLGALVLGTALPHLLRDVVSEYSWQYVMVATSGLALSGGMLVFFFIPDGPYRKKGGGLRLSAFTEVFRQKELRSAAFGYFGHMWELYAFWAFVPAMIEQLVVSDSTSHLNIHLWSFIVIAAGTPACIAGGYISQFTGHKRTAFFALLLSCICCLISPFIIGNAGIWTGLGFLMFWSFMVVPDSPMFSTLVANNSVPELKATALTIVNCIGFAITIVSIMCISELSGLMNHQYLYVILALGPVLGLIALISGKGLRSNVGF